MASRHLGNLAEMLADGRLGDRGSVIPGQYSAEASTLQLAPGDWPETLTIEAHGRLITLHRSEPHMHNEDLGWFFYDSRGDGLVNIQIFND